MPGMHATPEDVDGLSRATVDALARHQALIIEQGKQLGAVLERMASAEKRIAALEGSPDPGPVPQPGPAPAASPASAIRAVFIGNEVAHAEAHDRWVGQAGTPVLLFTEQRDWIASPDIGWWINRWGPTGRKVFWSIPPHPNNSNLEATAAGHWDGYFQRVARQLVEAYPTGDIVIRIGWEFNGNWFPWTIHGGRHLQFLAAWRRIVGVFRETGDRFRFDWCTNQGTSGANPELAYPGDDVVDIISQDVYWQRQWDGNDPIAAWQKKRAQAHGLDWLVSFAQAHDKPIAIPEWGVSGDDAVPYIEAFAAWIAACAVPVIYHAYWDSDAAYTGRLSGGRWPAAGAAYKAAFAGG